MILDAIAALIGALVGPLVIGIANVAIGFLNLCLYAFEWIVRLFVGGFKAGRLKTRVRSEKPSRAYGLTVSALLLAALTAVGISEISRREVQFVAVDGHSLPYAEVVIRTDDGERNERTDKAGRVKVPRFGSVSVTIIDPRYVVRTWTDEEIEKRLVVERTILGTSLDTMVRSLLKKDE